MLVAVLTLLSASVAGATPSATTDDSTEEIGPPGGLPDPVPDFVSSIPDVLFQFVEGELGGTPGEEVSGAAGNGGGSDA